MVQINFNATEHDPSTGGGDVWEAGTYSVQITNSELKETKKKDGYYLQFTLTCMDQGMAGRKIMARLNIHNPNPQAVEIAHRELSAISHVVGLLHWQDTQQLHGRPFKIAVSKEERNDKPGSFSNNIIGYMDYAGNPPSPTGNGGGQAAGSAPPAPPQSQQQYAPPAQQQQPAPGQWPQQGHQGGGFAQDQQHGQPPVGGQYQGNPGQPQTGMAPAPGQAPGAAPGAGQMQAGAPVQGTAPAPQPQQNFGAGGAPAVQPGNNGAPVPPWAQG